MREVYGLKNIVTIQTNIQDMKNTPLKVAELATIIYAILAFMSLLVDSAYYRQFNINIV